MKSQATTGYSLGLSPTPSGRSGRGHSAAPAREARAGAGCGARPGRAGPARPSPARHPRVEVPRQERRGHHHGEAEEALRREGERDEAEEQHELRPIHAALPGPPQRQGRPSEPDQRQEIAEVEHEVERLELGNDAKDRLVALSGEELERLDHRVPSVRIEERDHHGRDAGEDEAGAARTPCQERVEKIRAEHGQPECIGQVRIDPRPYDRDQGQRRVPPRGGAGPRVPPAGAGGATRAPPGWPRAIRTPASPDAPASAAGR